MRRRRKQDPKKDDETNSEAAQDDLCVERIRLENMELRLYITFEFSGPKFSDYYYRFSTCPCTMYLCFMCAILSCLLAVLLFFILCKKVSNSIYT